MSDLSMTYAQLAERLGIKQESAKRLAQRKKFHKTKGNDRLARVLVPSDFFAPDRSRKGGGMRGDAASSVTGDVSSDVTGDTLSLKDLRADIEVLKLQVEMQRQRADAAEQRIKDLLSERDAWKQQASQRAEEAQAQVHQALTERDAWKQQAQRSLWQRLFSK